MLVRYRTYVPVHFSRTLAIEHIRIYTIRSYAYIVGQAKGPYAYVRTYVRTVGVAGSASVKTVLCDMVRLLSALRLTQETNVRLIPSISVAISLVLCPSSA